MQREAKDWQGQRLYIAPDNPVGRHLALELKQQGAVVIMLQRANLMMRC